MAMTGGTKKLIKNGTKCDLYVYYKTSQDVANNKSTVTCGMYIVVPDNYPIGPWTDYNGSYVGRSSLTFNGSIDNVDGTIWLVENKSFTVEHKADGTASTTIYWKWGVNSSWGGMVNPSGSFTITLPTIPRKSSVSATNAYIGDKSTITISRKSSSFTHTLQYKISGQDSYTTIISKTSNTSYKWTIPSEAYNYLSSTGKTVKITINCITYSGSSKIGSSTYAITATGKNSDLKPSKPTLTGSIVNGFGSFYIKGKSSIKLTSTAPTTKYGATVKSYIFTGPNISGSSATYTGTSSTKTSSVIQSTGVLSYSVQVKDSRGVLSDKSEPVLITVSDYSAPTIKSMSLSKLENTSNMTITVTVVTTHRQIGSNAITVTMSNIGTTSPTVIKSSATTKNITTTTFTYTYDRVPLTSTGSVTATANDSVYPSKTTSKSVSITPASRALNIAKHGNGVAIGGLSSVTSSTETGKFECNWDMYMNKTFRFPQAWNDANNYPRITCLWKDGSYHEMITRSDDGLTMGIGWTGKHTNEDETTTQYDTQLSLRPPLVTASNTITAPRGRFTATDDASGTKQNDVALRVGDNTGNHIDFDGNEIQAKTNATTTGTLYLNNDGGDVQCGESLISGSNLYTNGKTEYYDGKQGISVSSNGRIYMTGDLTNASVTTPGIMFAHNKSTSATSSIVETESGEITINDLSIKKSYLTSKATYNRTYDKSGNVYITSTGILGRGTSSSRRYKTNIEEIHNEELNPYKILNIPVCQYKYNEDNIPIDKKPDDLYIGLIAEDVAKEYPVAAEYNEDGQVEMWNIKVIVPAMLKIIQDQQKKIESLESEMKTLKIEVDNMKK